jgi:hypothetical protein
MYIHLVRWANIVNVNALPSTQTEFEHTIQNWAGFSHFAKRILAPPPECLHLVMVGELAGLHDLTGYDGWNFMFLVGPPKPDRP